MDEGLHNQVSELANDLSANKSAVITRTVKEFLERADGIQFADNGNKRVF